MALAPDHTSSETFRPPKFHDLTYDFNKECSISELKSTAWEISVPKKKSLYWAILLGYLTSLNEGSEFDSFLAKHAPQGTKCDTTKIYDSKDLKKCLESFNPFKNRYVFFHNPCIEEVMKAFKLKLNQYYSKLKSKYREQSNDEIKLIAASEMLNCVIIVYFPDRNLDKMKTFSKPKGNNLKSVILFQYENQEILSRNSIENRVIREKANIFHFALNFTTPFLLQLSALAHFFKKAKISPYITQHVKQCQDSYQNNGQNFLYIILRNGLFDILFDLYKSPYIALKLAEAGFEINPTRIEPDKVSPFTYSLIKPDTKYFRILYDYAANCRYRYDKTTRDADENVIFSLNIINNVISNDISNLHSCNFDKITSERIFRNLDEILHFNEYQKNIAVKMNDLQHELDEELSEECIRKKIIVSILESCTDFFYYKSSSTNDISATYENYLNFTEYYENSDCFSGLLFFDNIHLLKKAIPEYETIHADVELTFFYFILSNKMFPKFKHEVECQSKHDKTECEKENNVLKLIPLFYREMLKDNINCFINNLKQYTKSKIARNQKKKREFRDPVSIPEIRDELLIVRLRYYLEAALETPVEESGIKSVLAIERALQVIGESIKPQSTKGCVVSYLLNSQLSADLTSALINIRDDLLSHYTYNSSRNRLSIANNVELFTKLQDELKKIQATFQIVDLMQHLRMKEYFMKNHAIVQEIKNSQLNQCIKTKFSEESKMQLTETHSKEYSSDCITLSVHALNALIERLAKCSDSDDREHDKIHGMLKAVEFIINFMNERLNINDFKYFGEMLKEYATKYESEKQVQDLRENIELLKNQYLDMIQMKFKIPNITKPILDCPTLKNFLTSHKNPESDIKPNEVEEIIEAIKICYNEATKAKEELIQCVKENLFNSETTENTITKLFASRKDIKTLRKYLSSENKKMALNKLQKMTITEDSIEKETNEALEKHHTNVIRNILIKIIFQRKRKSKIYDSVNLRDDLCNKLENFLTMKMQFLLNRTENIKRILIDEDDEIKATWKWGRSEAIKHHMKFLMRQRFLREWPTRASLEMSFFDCLNILQKDDFKDIYEKLNHLFTGINLRNILAHGYCVLEKIGGILDKDDLPSELISKMLDLIEDGEIIKYMQELRPESDCLEEEDFETWIETNEDREHERKIKKIINCPRWRKYLFLLPLI